MRCSSSVDPPACSSPCSSTAGIASFRSGPTTSARTCRRGVPSGSRSSSSRSTSATACSSSREREDGRRCLSCGLRRRRGGICSRSRDLDSGRRRAHPRDRARSLAASLDREVKKLPTLRGRTVVNLFYESSTRTLASFELAAKRLSADTMSLALGRLVGRQGRVAQGHGAHARGVRARRHRRAPPVDRRARARGAATDAHVVNAGDGKHQHPTQALLDLYTIREALGRLDGRPRRDRRRRAPLPGRPLARPGARARRRGGDARRPADARAARHRVARLRGLARHRRDRATPTSSTCSGCSASGWSERVRALAARVHGAATGSRPSASRAGQVVMHPGR